MYCSNCGKRIQDTDKFCDRCGAKISLVEKSKENTTKSISKEETIREDENWKVNDYIPEELRKSVKNAGESVFALGIFSIVVSPIIYILSLYEEEDYISLILIILITSFIYAFFIHLGNKIRKDTLEDLNITLKNVSNTISYSIIVFILFILSGGWLGIFGIIMLINLFKAKKQLRANI